MRLFVSIVLLNFCSQQDMVVSVVKKLGGFYIEEKVKENTTHVVCGSNRRTLNVLYAISRGVWLISLEWVWNCKYLHLYLEIDMR